MNSYKNHPNYKNVFELINSMLNGENIVSSDVEKLHDLLYKYDDSKQKSMVGEQILEAISDEPESDVPKLFDEIFMVFDSLFVEGNYKVCCELLKKSINQPHPGEAFIETLFDKLLKSYIEDKKQWYHKNNKAPDVYSYKNHPNYEIAVELLNNLRNVNFSLIGKNTAIKKQYTSNLSQLDNCLFKYKKDDNKNSKQDSMVGKQVLEFISDEPKLFGNIYNSFEKFCKSNKHLFYRQLIYLLKKIGDQPRFGEAFMEIFFLHLEKNINNLKHRDRFTYKNHPNYEEAVKCMNEFNDNSDRLYKLLFEYKRANDNNNHDSRQNSMAGMQILEFVPNEPELFDEIYDAFAESFHRMDLVSELNSFCNMSHPGEAFLDYLFGHQKLKKIINEKRNMNRENDNVLIDENKQFKKAVEFIKSLIEPVADNSELTKSVLVSEKQWDELFNILFKGKSESRLGREFQEKAKNCVQTALSKGVLTFNINNADNTDNNTNNIVIESSNEGYESYNEDIFNYNEDIFNDEVERVVLYLCGIYYSYYSNNYPVMNTYLNCFCSNLNDSDRIGEEFVNYLLEEFLKSIPNTSIGSIIHKFYKCSPEKNRIFIADEDKYNDFMNSIPSRDDQDKDGQNKEQDRFDVIREVLIRITDCMTEKNSWQTEDYIFTAGLEMYPHLKNCKDFNLTPDQVNLCNELCEWVESIVNVDLLKIEHDKANKRREEIKFNRENGKNKGSLSKSYIDLWCNPLDANQLAKFYTDPKYTSTPKILKNPVGACLAKRSRYKDQFLEFNILDTILGALDDDEHKIISEVLKGFSFNKKTNWRTDYYFIIGLQLYPYLKKCEEFGLSKEQVKRCLALKHFVEDFLIEHRQSRNDIFFVVDLDREYTLIQNDINQQIKQKEDDICLSEKEVEEYKSEKENLNKATPKDNEKIKNLALDIRIIKEKLKKFPQDIIVLKKRLLIAPFDDAKQVEKFCNVNFELAERMIFDYLSFLRSIFSKIRKSKKKKEE